MHIYVGFDDTDTINSDRGTGKLARWMEQELPEGCRLWGVVRQQLLVDPAIPYTSHNSAACAIVESPDGVLLEAVIERAVNHIRRHFISGSDPGLCVVPDDSPALSGLIAFGRSCTERVVTQQDALMAVDGVHLSGHGGTNDGIIGAAAAVGLTAHGWGGRFVEFGRLRDFPEMVLVSELEKAGIAVVSVDRDGGLPALGDVVDTKGWLRPRLWGGKAVLPVTRKGEKVWETLEQRKSRMKEKKGGG